VEKVEKGFGWREGLHRRSLELESRAMKLICDLRGGGGGGRAQGGSDVAAPLKTLGFNS